MSVCFVFVRVSLNKVLMLRQILEQWSGRNEQGDACGALLRFSNVECSGNEYPANGLNSTVPVQFPLILLKYFYVAS